MKESFTLRSTISSEMIKSTLFKGSMIAFIGIFILLLGIFISPSFLQQWGLGLFLISLGLVTGGLLPYRYLSHLQLNPHLLVLDDKNHLTFYKKGKKILTLPLQSISKIQYIPDPKYYGVAIWLKPPPIDPIIVHQLSTEVNKLRYKGFQVGQADLFLPYFNQYTYRELMEWQQESEEQDFL